MFEVENALFQRIHLVVAHNRIELSAQELYESLLVMLGWDARKGSHTPCATSSSVRCLRLLARSVTHKEVNHTNVIYFGATLRHELVAALCLDRALLTLLFRLELLYLEKHGVVHESLASEELGIIVNFLED